MDRKDEIVRKVLSKLRRQANFIMVGTSGTKFVKDQDTGVPCITVFVKEKVDERLLAYSDVIPKEIDGIPVDVVEFKADYEIGETSKSRLPPDLQKRLMGLKK